MKLEFESKASTNRNILIYIATYFLHRRLTLQQNQSGGSGLSLGDPLLRLNSSPTRAASLASNDDNDASSVIAQAGDIYEERSGGPNLRGMVDFFHASNISFLPYHYVFFRENEFQIIFQI